jgi:hypothetical protein
MWMIRGLGENILDNAFGQFAGALVLFQDNEYGHAWFDVCASLPIHILSWPGGRVARSVSEGHIETTAFQKIFRLYGTCWFRYAPTITGLLNQRIHFIQKYSEIEITWRMTIFCEERRGFTAMLCAVIDDMQ